MCVGLAEGKTETQSSLWTMAVAMVGETQSHMRIRWKVGLELSRQAAVSSLAPLPQAAPQCSKEGCPAQENT